MTQKTTDTLNKEKMPFTLRHASLLTGLAVGLAVGLALAFGAGSVLEKYEHATASTVQMTGADVPDVPALAGEPTDQLPLTPAE